MYMRRRIGPTTRPCGTPVYYAFSKSCDERETRAMHCHLGAIKHVARLHLQKRRLSADAEADADVDVYAEESDKFADDEC